MATEPIVEELMGMCVDAGGSSIGMPQLCADWFPNQIFWLIVTLIVIYYVLSRIALPRIGSVLAERAGTITNDIAAAEDLKVKAQAAEATYDKALADARAEANRIVAEAKADIQAELDTELAAADATIAERMVESERAIADIRDSAKASVSEVARDVAAEIVRVMGGTPDQPAIDAAVAAHTGGVA